MKQFFYVGSYTTNSEKGLYYCELDYEDKEIGLVESYCLENPSYLCKRKGNSALYAVVESEIFEGKRGGGIVYFEIGRDGRLREKQKISSGGAYPCHLSFNEKEDMLFVSNYGEGSLTICKVQRDHTITTIQEICHEESGSGGNKERQEKAHVHFAKHWSALDTLYVCDLGIDKVIGYHLRDGKYVLSDSIQMKTGSGPRHFETQDTFMYVLNELSSTVSVYDFQNNEHQLIQTISTLSKPNKESTCAAIRFSTDGKFLVASNRGDDSLSIFEREASGMLQLQAITPCGGKCPRDFAFDETGNFIVCANQLSHALSLLEMDWKKGSLSLKDNLPIMNPTCILF